MSKLFASSPSFANALSPAKLWGTIVNSLPAFLFWLVVYAALWYVLAGGGGWAFGIPTVLLACLLAVYLQAQPWRIQLRHLPFFLFFFLRSALVGGADVARRAVHVRCPIAPAWVHYRFRSHDSQVRLLVSAIVGLFPGTLASKIEGDRMHVHVLDKNAGWQSTVRELEDKLTHLLPLEDNHSGRH